MSQTSSSVLKIQTRSLIYLKIADFYMLWAKGLSYAKLQKVSALAFLEPNLITLHEKQI